MWRIIMISWESLPTSLRHVAEGALPLLLSHGRMPPGNNDGARESGCESRPTSTIHG